MKTANPDYPIDWRVISYLLCGGVCAAKAA